jgi:hypothetical protein
MSPISSVAKTPKVMTSHQKPKPLAKEWLKQELPQLLTKMLCKKWPRLLPVEVVVILKSHQRKKRPK